MEKKPKKEVKMKKKSTPSKKKENTEPKSDKEEVKADESIMDELEEKYQRKLREIDQKMRMQEIL